MAHSIAVVCEDQPDRDTGCDLADRVFLKEVSWLEEQMLDHCRQWRGFSAEEPYLTWPEAKKLADAHNVKSHGFFDGKPAAHDAHAARKALLLIQHSDETPDAVVLLRDDDGDESRRQGLEQARKSFKVKTRIAIGVAHTKRECWVLAGFQPRDDSETKRLRKLRSELGFDPSEKAEKLTAGGLSDKKSAKRVLKTLTGGHADREAGCWKKTDLTVLARRGKNTGLADYLNDVSQRLVPLLRPGPPPA